MNLSQQTNDNDRWSGERTFVVLGVLTLILAGFVVFIQDVHAATFTSITPTVITPGVTEMTIVGSGFSAYDSNGDQVCFNAIVGGYSTESYCSTFGTDDITSWNDTTIVFTVPLDPSAVMIGGRIHVNVNGTLFDGPYYHIQPVITATDASSAWPGSKITLTGRYFTNALGSPDTYYLHVFFNGVEGIVASTDWTSSEIIATVPKGATTGPVSMTLAVADGSASVTAAGPTITIFAGTTNDDYSAYQQYIKQVNIDAAWSLVSGGKAPIVAIIDDGVYINHPDIRKNIWINTKERIGNGKDDDHNGYIDDIYGWDFISKGGEMTVRGTHGTMVAGIIGAVNNNGEGITGINPSVKIMSLIVCDDQGCSTDRITKAIRYAVDQGAKVINLSLSTWATTGYTTAFNGAIQYANSKGVIVVAAAGNGDVESGTGQDLDIIPQSPVCNDVGKYAVIGVGAVDSNNYLPSWSNFGSKCVDTFAPGVDIVTTAVAKYNKLIPGSNYGYGDGTSFAAPIVTGIVSLLLQKYPGIPPLEVVKRIRRNTTNSVIDAYKVLSDVYVRPIRDRENDLNKNINADQALTERVQGKFLFSTKSGTLWYVSAKNGKRYQITTNNLKVALLRLSTRIADGDLKNIPTVRQKAVGNLTVEKFNGKIVRDSKQKYWYINPQDGRRHEVSSAAIRSIRSFASGISSSDLSKILIGLIE